MKKAIIMICLACMIGNVFGAVLKTVSGEELIGKLVGKRDGHYLLEHKDGLKFVRVEEVAKLMNGFRDDTQRFANMEDWGIEPANEMQQMIMDSLLELEYEKMTPYERQLIMQMKELNQNTNKIHRTMYNIAAFSIILSLLTYFF